MNRDEKAKALAHLDAIDDVLGRPNLGSALSSLAFWSLFVDPVFGKAQLTDAEMDMALRQAGHNRIRPSCPPGHAIAYFAMTALLHSNPYRRREMTERDLCSAMDHYTHCDAPMFGSRTDCNLHDLFIPLAYQQFPFQRHWYDHLPSAHFMFTRSESHCGFSLSEAVATIVGVSYDNLLQTCIWLCFMFNQHQGARLAPSGPSNLPWLEEGRLECILASISQTQQEFRETYERNRNSDEALRIYDFNPLFDRPLIRIGSEYYAPVPALIPMWAAKGIVYRLLRQCGNGTFTSTLGPAFEGYVGHLLSKTKHKVYPEIRMSSGRGEEKTADYVVVEGNRALILDCKTRRFGLDARYGDQASIGAELSKTVSKGLKQAKTTEDYIRQGRPELVSVGNPTEFQHAVVTWDDYYLANNSGGNRTLADEGSGNTRYHVLSGDELGLVLANIEDGDLIGFLDDRMCSDLSSPSFYGYIARCSAETGEEVKDPGREFVLAQLRRMEARLIEAGWTQ